MLEILSGYFLDLPEKSWNSTRARVFSTEAANVGRPMLISERSALDVLVIECKQREYFP